MYNIFINVVAWTTIISIVVLLLVHIIIYICHILSNSTINYVGIKRTTYFGRSYNECYIIPSISFIFSKNYKTITISWFYWNYDITYEIFTEADENLEAAIKREINKQNES